MLLGCPLDQFWKKITKTSENTTSGLHGLCPVYNTHVTSPDWIFAMKSSPQAFTAYASRPISEIHELLIWCLMVYSCDPPRTVCEFRACIVFLFINLTNINTDHKWIFTSSFYSSFLCLLNGSPFPSMDAQTAGLYISLVSQPGRAGGLWGGTMIPVLQVILDFTFSRTILFTKSIRIRNWNKLNIKIFNKYIILNIL